MTQPSQVPFNIPDEYVAVDGQLTTSELMTDEEILATVMGDDGG